MSYNKINSNEKISYLQPLYKAYTGERAWKTIGDRLQAPIYLSRVDHHWKIRARKKSTDIGKYSFVNRYINGRNQLPERAIGNSYGKTGIFKTRVRKV
jgi:hypothetical protein